jgi:hypothetical protein
LEQNEEQTAGVMVEEEVEGPVSARPEVPSAMREEMTLNPEASEPATMLDPEETPEVAAEAAEEMTAPALVERSPLNLEAS